MLKDKDTQPTLFQEDFPANHSQSQEKEEEQMMTDTYGMKLLELSESANQNILLAKMLRVLLTSPMVKCCNRYKKIWKKKISKSNVLLFQLQVSVLGIKERESGLSDVIYQTPTTQDSRIGINNIGGNKHRVKRGSIALADQILFPTPRSCEMEGGVVKNVEINNGSFSRKNKKGVRFGVKLKDAVHKIYGTPKAQDSRAALTDRGKSNLGEQIHQEYNAKKLGGRLNPNFVEFLMGYPMNWTKIESTE